MMVSFNIRTILIASLLLQFFNVYSLTRTEAVDTIAQNGFWGDQGYGTYRNPILAADFSDPDPLRVGDDYYLVSSTFESSPGVTVLHSKDLVNWEIIGAPFADLSKVNIAFSHKMMKRYGLGVYAPSIRYHNGLFYIYVNLYSDGMFVATAKDPAGEWNCRPLLDKNGKPLLMQGWTDPCPFWDEDGHAYLASSNPGKNWYGYIFQMTYDGCQLLDADVNHMRIRDIVYQYPDGGTLYSRNYSTEGNKIYKRNGYYYILHIEFLDGGNGAGTYIYRSRNLYGTKDDGTAGKPGDIGKYEIRRTDIQRKPYIQELPGQGGMVDTQDGRWFWIGQFNRYAADGRVPCLIPVTWIDDWPVFGDDIEDGFGKMKWQREKPIKSNNLILPHHSDNFSSTSLAKIWMWNHQPSPARWTLKERKGYLRLYADTTVNRKDEFFKAANTICQRYMSSAYVEIKTKIDLSGMAIGQKAGLVHFNGGKDYAFIGIRRTSAGYVLLHEINGKITQGSRIPCNTIYLRSVSKFVARKTVGQYSVEPQQFSYSIDGKEYIEFGCPYNMGTANFRGDMIGVFTFNNSKPSGYIDIDWFKYDITNK